jgi:mono/diheme cytochrome c family protein
MNAEWSRTGVSVACVLTMASAGAQQPSTMQDHYSKAMATHTAVIRGDLTAVSGAATEWLAQIDRTAWPAAGAPHVDAMRAAAKELAGATLIGAAGAAMGRTLGACGACHRASGVMPAAPAEPARPVGGIVGHMLEHQRALSNMVEGLVVPSTSRWQEGANALKAAPLKRDGLPRSSRSRDRLVALERDVHALADRAAAAETPDARATVYGDLAAGCAQCHALHVKVWGPSPR